MRVSFRDNVHRSDHLQAEIKPSDYVLTGIAIETGIELERVQHNHTTLPPNHPQHAEALLTLARWTNDTPSSDEESLQLNHRETTWALTGLSYLRRSLAIRALDTIERRFSSSALPDIGVPSHGLQTAARKLHRQAHQSLVQSLGETTVSGDR